MTTFKNQTKLKFLKGELKAKFIIPIAGVILAFVMTLELIQMVADKNNMHGDVDTWMFFKWIFKTAAAVLIVTNTWNIVMGVFDVGQSVVNSAAGVIVSDASIDINTVVVDLEDRLMAMDIGPLLYSLLIYLSKPDNELPVTPMMEAFAAAYKKRRTKNGTRA